MNCSQTRKLLSAYVDGELFGREAADVAAHVEACPSCQLEFHDLTLVKDMLGRLPQVPAPSSLYIGVMARLQETAFVPADESRFEPAARAATSRPAARRASAWIGRGWKTGVAAAAVAAFAFAWGMKLVPSAPPLVAEGGNSSVPSGQTVPEPVRPPEQPEPVQQEPRPVIDEPVTQPPAPTDVPLVTVPSEPGEQVTPEPDVFGPAKEPPVDGGTDAAPPDLGGGRFGTANTQLPVVERLVAKTMHVSLTAADPQAFAAKLGDLATSYGVELGPGDDGAIRVLVQNDQAMRFVDAIKELAVPDTFRWMTNSETDVTEAVRNLTAERDFLQKVLADGDDSVQADLLIKEARLADYFREIEHLALEIMVKGPGG